MAQIERDAAALANRDNILQSMVPAINATGEAERQNRVLVALARNRIMVRRALSRIGPMDPLERTDLERQESEVIQQVADVHGRMQTNMQTLRDLLNMLMRGFTQQT